MSTAALHNRTAQEEEHPLRRLEKIDADLKARLGPSLDLSVTVHDTVSSIEQKWKELQAFECVSPHQSLDWCKAWVKTNQNDLTIVEIKRGGDTVAILPLEITPCRGGRSARFIAADYTNINTGIIDPAFAQSVSHDEIKDIVAQIKAAISDKADLIVMRNMPAIWMGVPNPFCQLSRVENQNHAFQLPLLDSFEETLTQINAKRRRKKYRVSHKRLEQLGGYEHILARTRDEKRETLELFFKQKAARFAAAGLPDVFKSRNIQSFFHEALEQSNVDGDYCLRLHALRLNNETRDIIAIAGMSRKGGHVVCQFASIDDTIAPETSPGEFLFHLAIEQINNEGAKVFDFGIGDMLYKRSWCPQETIQYDVLIPLTVKGQALAKIAKIATRAKAAIKKNPLVYSLVQRIRAIRTSRSSE